MQMQCVHHIRWYVGREERRRANAWQHAASLRALETMQMECRGLRMPLHNGPHPSLPLLVGGGGRAWHVLVLVICHDH